MEPHSELALRAGNQPGEGCQNQVPVFSWISASAWLTAVVCSLERHNLCRKPKWTELAHSGEGTEKIMLFKHVRGSCKGKENTSFFIYVTDLASCNSLNHGPEGLCKYKEVKHQTRLLKAVTAVLKADDCLSGMDWVYLIPAQAARAETRWLSETKESTPAQYTIHPVVLKTGGSQRMSSSQWIYQLRHLLTSKPPITVICTESQLTSTNLWGTPEHS